MDRQIPSLTVRNAIYLIDYIMVRKMIERAQAEELGAYSAETARTLGGPGVPSVTVVPKTICKF